MADDNQGTSHEQDRMGFRFPRLQFSLRTLILVMIVVVGILGWIGTRYARHHERLKANAPLLEAQAAFAAAQVRVDISAGRNSTLESCEVFVLGDVGNPHADLLSFRTNSFDAKAINQTIRAAKSLHLFSEIESVEGHHGVPGTPLPNEFLDALLKLPKLKELTIRQGAIFDDRAVSVLPNDSPLEKLHVATPQLTSAGVTSLLQKAPKLNQLWLNEQALSPEVAGLLNQCIALQADSHLDLPMRVFSSTTDMTLGQKVEEGLQQLNPPYELLLNPGPTNPCAHPWGVVLPNTAPKTYSGLHAKSLRAAVADMVTVIHFDELMEADISETTGFHLADCPRLEKLSLKLCHDTVLERLPALTQLHLQMCGKLQIQDCVGLQSVGYLGFRTTDVQPSLVLQRLPQLRSITYAGSDLTLVDVPALEQMTLYNATSDLLVTVRGLPSLQILILRFDENCKELSADELLSLRKLATLKKLYVYGFLPVPRDQRADLLNELNQFPNFRFSKN
jgi:hypothetical protein